jgi:hypothetical protein
MGSWFETCFVSHLPIRDGEKCRLFILEHMEGWKSDRVGAGLTYPHDVWAPCSFAIPGEYDSYGRVVGVKEDSLEVRLAMQRVRERLIELPASTTGRCGPAIVAKELTTLTFQDAVEQGRVRFKDYRGREQPYGLVRVRDDVYRAIMGRAISCSWRQPERLSVARFVRQGEALVAALRVKAAEKALETEPWKQLMFSSDIEFIKYEGKEQEYDLPNFFAHSVMEFGDRLGQHLVDMVVADSPDVPRLLRLSAEHIMFSCHLAALRRAWMPQPGRGSQDESYDAHVWLAKLVQKVAEKEMARED